LADIAPHLVDEQQRLFDEAASRLAPASITPQDVQKLRVDWLGKSHGVVTGLLGALRTVPKDEKAAFGARVNSLKEYVEGRLRALDADAAERAARAALLAKAVDVTLPPRRLPVGRLHPLSVVRRRLEACFGALGYAVADGPEVESDWYNFESLNFPPDHPARDAVDTFFVKDGGVGKDRLLLRTHTSPVQMRTMLSTKPPIRVICPGRVYRKDDIDPRHSPVFHQLEGLAVDEGITFADLKGTLAAFAKTFFSERTRIRFGPTFFPFVEPGVDVAVSCVFCEGSGISRGAASEPPEAPRCRICSGSGWIEIMGAGMVHPKVLAAGGIDPDRYTGFAFGMGIDRIAFLVYGVPDLRLFFENDQRLLDRVWS